MKKLFKNIPLNGKLALLAIVPVAFILYLSADSFQMKTENLRQIENFQKEFSQSKKVSELVEVLQNERRSATGYLLDRTDLNTLKNDRLNTDKVIRALDQNMSKTVREFKELALLNSLDSLRSLVDKRTVKVTQCIDTYVMLIERSNSLEKYSPDNLSNFGSLSLDIQAYKSMSKIITNFTTLRANISNAFASNQFETNLLSRISNSNKLLTSYQREFHLRASDKYQNQYTQIKNSSTSKRVESIIGDVLNEEKDINNFNDTVWWEMTTSINQDMDAFRQNMYDDLEARSTEIYNKELSARNLNLIFLVIVLFIIIIVIILTIGSIANALSELKNSAYKIAKGETNVHVKVETNDVIGELGKAIKIIDDNAVALSLTAEQIGHGNFNVEIHPRGEKDELSFALSKMKNSLHQFDVENQLKLKTQKALNLIGNSVLGEKNINELSENVLQSIVDFFKFQMAAFYISNDHEELHYVYSIGIDNLEKTPKVVKYNEGLIGKMSREKKVTQTTDLPSVYFKIQSATGEIVPKNLIFIPLHYDNHLEGVIELANLRILDVHDLEILNLCIEPIALAIKVAKSREKLQELLEETQAQSEELQSQQSELENMNAELEAQAQNLQASEEELRVQQEELQQTNTELERRSAELVDKNEEIIRKASELELSTKYKSEFLANMSHELRTPLNSILLLSRLLSENHDRNLTPEQMEFAKVIQNSGNGLLHLIDEILDLSKIEAGKMDVDIEQFRITDFLQEIKSLFYHVAQEKDITFEIITESPKDFMIATDKMKLGQVIKNLISNALKFTENGTVQVFSDICKINPNYYCISVKDNGIGISKEKQKLIFEAFQQEDGSTKRKFGGTGLGLSISRELVKLLGGEIKVESEQGEGSTFTIFIPIDKAQATPLPQKSEASPKEEKSKDTSLYSDYISKDIPDNIEDDRLNILPEDKLILIIEDDVNFAKSLLNFSRDRGYKAVICVRGDEAIDMATLYKPVGILLDVELPIISGWEIIDKLKSESSTRHIPVHMMSSHKMKNTGITKGAIDFIEKPLAYEKMDVVFEKIEEVLKKQPKKILIFEDNDKHAQALVHFLKTNDIHAEINHSLKDGLKTLKHEEIDCIVLDMGIPDVSSYELLEKAKSEAEFGNLPIIVFTGKSLSEGEEMRIKKYADTIVVKTAHSYQRMLDEVSLFLHVVEDNTQSGEKLMQHRKVYEEILENKTILIADDDVRNIFSLTKVLENYRVNVISAIDGEEAIKKIKENDEIDLVLLDMMMPRVDGYEAAQAIRKIPKFKKLPIIAVTAKAMSGDREKCIQAGASDYITKPVDIDQLLSLLRVWLYD